MYFITLAEWIRLSWKQAYNIKLQYSRVANLAAEGSKFAFGPIPHFYEGLFGCSIPCEFSME